jgi:hypothetical protein
MAPYFEETRSWVWADLDAPNPWRGRVAVLTSRKGDARFFAHDGSQPKTINGAPGNIGPLNVFQGVTSDAVGYQATWAGADGRIHEIILMGGDEEDTRQMAERVTADAAGVLRLPGDALGSRTGLLYAVPTEHDWSDPALRLSYVFVGPDTDDPGDALDFWVEETSPERLELERLFTADRSSVAIGGHPGEVLATWDREKGPFLVRWQLPDGRTARLSSLDLSREESIRMAQSVRPIDSEEWDRLKRDAAECGTGSFAGVTTTP